MLKTSSRPQTAATAREISEASTDRSWLRRWMSPLSTRLRSCANGAYRRWGRSTESAPLLRPPSPGAQYGTAASAASMARYMLSPQVARRLAPDIAGLLNGFVSLDGHLVKHNTAFDRFQEKRLRLAMDVHSATPSARTARPSLTHLQGLNSDKAIAAIFERSDGIVVGAYNTDMPTYRFLIDHMDALCHAKVKTLYLDTLVSELHQSDLDKYGKHGKLSKQLGADIANEDILSQIYTDQPHNLTALIKLAQQRGIRIVAASTMVSRYLKGIEQDMPEDLPDNHDLADIQHKMRSFTAASLIGQDQVTTPGKWVAWVDPSLENLDDPMQTLAESCGAIGIRVMEDKQIEKDTQAKTNIEADSYYVALDPGEVATGIRHARNPRTLRSDLLITLVISNARSSSHSSLPLPLPLPPPASGLASGARQRMRW